jgi:hypothetical protein
MPESPRWKTPREAADYLTCSVRQLQILEAEGKLIPSRVLGPRSPRYDVHQLDAFMAGEKPQETPAENSGVRLAAM